MRVAVTGGSGFIGSRLLNRLEGSGIPALSLPHTLTLNDLVQKLNHFRPTVLVHLASVFIAEHKPDDLDILVDSNIRFGVLILEACKMTNVHRAVVIGSSWQHFGSESDVSVNLYGALKNGLEAIARFYSDAHQMSIAYLKLYDSYGPGDTRPKLIPYLVKLASSGGTLDLSQGDQIVDFTHVQNIIDAILKGCEWTEKSAGVFQDFRVSGGEPMSLRSLVDIVEKITGSSFKVRWGARSYRAREVMRPWTEASELPGYTPRISLAEGLKELFKGP